MKKLLGVFMVLSVAASGTALADRHHGGGHERARESRHEERREARHEERRAERRAERREERREVRREERREERYEHRRWRESERRYHYRDYYSRPSWVYEESFEVRPGYEWRAGSWIWDGAEWLWTPGSYVRVVVY